MCSRQNRSQPLPQKFGNKIKDQLEKSSKIYLIVELQKAVPVVSANLIANRTMSGEDVYKDLINFLQSERADLRLAASQAVLGVTDR